MQASVESLSPTPQADDFPYNDDLLLLERDRVQAQRLYPDIFYALYHKELCQEFEQVDRTANDAKKQSRTSGTRAVLLVSLALLLAVSEPLYTGYHWVALLLALISGGCGIAGALIGKFGVLHARQKRDWLENRLRTEKMRNFHFRTMLELSHLLLAGKQEEYLKERAHRFDVLHDELRNPTDELQDIVSNEDPGRAPKLPALAGIDASAAGQWQGAYQRLRIQRQNHYARHKLRNDTSILSRMPRRQAAVFAAVAAICVAGLILTHLGVAIDVMWHVPGDIRQHVANSVPVEHSDLTWLHVGGLWIAIVALGLRTLQEGLDPGREVERYRHYRAAMQALEEHFSAAQRTEEKLTVAASVERAATNEMLIFLRSGNEARFVM